MHERMTVAAICIAAFAMSAAAQMQMNTFPSNGNAGIGTTSPNGALQVNVGAQWSASNFGANVIISGTRNNALGFLDYQGNNPWAIVDQTGGRLAFDMMPPLGNTSAIPTNVLTLMTSGYVGIGTPVPSQTLEVNGNALVDGSLMVSSNGIGFRDGTTQTTAFNPAGNLSTAGAIISGGFLTSSISSSTIGGTLSLVNPAKTTAGTAQTWDIFNMTGGYGNSLQFWAYDSIGCNNGGLCNPRLTLTDSGSLGIGTTTPQAKLEINGNLRFTADGSVQTTAWTGTLCGGDYAEAVDAKGSRKSYEPGDVLVIGDGADGSDGEVQKSGAPYSTMVAGIFATKPGVIGRRQSLLKEAEEIPMAMVGIVPTKVTAENGPIHRGDLLVTSSAIGYAMKGTDRNRMLGAVIGKAMGSLDSGTGVIEVLVTLQ